MKAFYKENTKSALDYLIEYVILLFNQRAPLHPIYAKTAKAQQFVLFV